MDKDVEALMKVVESIDMGEISRLMLWNKLLSNIDVSNWLHERGSEGFELIKQEFDEMFNARWREVNELKIKCYICGREVDISVARSGDDDKPCHGECLIKEF